ncbi:histone-lysine N-methyltransferase PRDM9 [Dermacentor silvarum]|uniref:histone-lysine N-methyltransferase PRDM9 n=1 Tax=Dermacentor silvarum TaxID=543639 RepID=UPI0021009980|nr:histone-lysine N-methyltransferase PRDM9 [Dermacentor silvarum]
MPGRDDGNIKRNYMAALDLRPAVPEFMKPKPVAPKPVSKNSAQSRSEQPQPKKPANTAKPPKTDAKGKENSGAIKLAPRKQTWMAPVKDQAVVADNKQLAAGAATDHKTSTGSVSPGDIRYPRQQRKEVNYMECVEGPDEEYLFCDDCKMDYPGDCPVHGPLMQVKDTPVPLGDPQRANKTVPEGLSVRRSTIKGAQYGVFTLKRLPKRLCFGPYEGVKVDDSSAANGYIWEIRENGRVILVDGRPLDRSNWMRYVNCAPEQSQQNLAAFVRQGAVYYRTCKVVNAAEELLVWYGDDFARQLGLIGNAGAQDQAAEVEVAAPREVFSCEECGDQFTVKQLLDHHRRRKHTQRPQGKHQCAHCPYSSNRRDHVTKHETIHTGERPFVCHVCDRGFNRRWSFSRHLLVHTGERPHACSECGKRFARRGAAKRHEQVVHGRHCPLRCPHCGKGCGNISDLRRHVRARHNDEYDDDR